MNVNKNSMIELLENELEDFKNLQEKYKNDIDEFAFYNGCVSTIEYLLIKIKE